MKKAQKILIAGFGDIGRRVARRLLISGHYRVMALARKTRDPSRRARSAKSHGVQLVPGDLSDLHSMRKLSGLADTILHLAPPPSVGRSDTHTEHLLAALSGMHCPGHFVPHPSRSRRSRMLPRRIVYISTTGVYGNCNGEWIDETCPVRPETGRAQRRVDAERRLQKWGRLHAVAITVLRAPGIYAHDRLPLERLRRQTPVLLASEDVFTNHIHADDLATAVVRAIRQRWPKRWRVFNVVDDNQLRMGDYFDLVADAFDMPRPPRISRQVAMQQIAPAQLSFMRESRRIRNARIKRELGLTFRYPTLPSVLAGV